MAGNQESENQLQQLHSAWEEARTEFGAESPECLAALEKYSVFLLEIGERPTSSESTAKAILGQQRPKPDCNVEAASNDLQKANDSAENKLRLSSGVLVNERYRIIRWIGQGGMSRVYLVNDLALQKELALKIVHSNLKNDKDTLKQFSQETMAGSQLNHPNLTRVYDFGLETNGHPFIAMEYIDGRTLGQLLSKEKRLAPEKAVHIFCQVCEALAHAHSQKIIHGDIKPSNIILIKYNGDADFVKVVDFGFSQVLNEQDGSDGQTTSGVHVFGSPHYMSPEQCQGEQQDARSDIYSLACVMFETLSGSPPFTGSIDEIMHKQIYELPGRINSESVENPQLLKQLELIIFRCLAKLKEDRYQSMALLKIDLNNLLEKQQETSLIERLWGGLRAKFLKQDPPEH